MSSSSEKTAAKLEQLRDEYLDTIAKDSTRASHRGAINKLIDYLDKNPLSKRRLAEFRQSLLEDVRQGIYELDSVETFVSSVREFAKWLIGHQKLLACSLQQLNQYFAAMNGTDDEISADQVLTDLEAKNVRNSCEDPRERALIGLTLGAGLRISEAIDVTPDNIFEKEGDYYLKVVKGKNNKNRLIPIAEDIADLLQGYLLVQDRDLWVEDSNPILISRENPSLSVSAAQRAIKKVVNRAGIDRHITSHNLRHSFATFHLNRGVPLHEVSSWLGHSGPDVTWKKYCYFSDTDYPDAFSAPFNA